MRSSSCQADDGISPVRWLLLLAVAVTLTGCGNAAFATQATTAARNVAKARELGAETLAPYDFYSAEEYLKKARSEAAEADYGDARLLARESNRRALQAIQTARDARLGAVQ